MNILGISSNYHDSSAALLMNGKLIASSAEERFTLQKHDSSFPLHAIEFCLRKGKIQKSDIDFVVYHEEPLNKLSRTISSALANFPFSFKTFLKSTKQAISNGIWIRQEVSTYLEIAPEKVVFIPHHMSHAAYSFLSSGFDESIVVTIDAIGEWTASGIFHAKKSNGKISIEPLHIIPFPHSLGLFYSAITAYLGFKANDSECSTMALAAFGSPAYLKEFREVLFSSKEDNLYSLDLSFFDFSSDEDLPISKKFIDLFGPPRNFKSKLPFNSFKDFNEQNKCDESKRFADIASTAQFVLEEKILELVSYSKKFDLSNNICLSGGVALNCVANGKILESKLYKNVYVPFDPGDGGGAAGAALYGQLILDPGLNIKPIPTPYLGESYSSQVVDDILNYSSFYSAKYKKLEFINDNDLSNYVANEIYNGKIAGWFQGCFESGPRALGNRSLLFRPDDLVNTKRLSDKIKKRAYFRPYACSLTPELAKKIFTSELSDSDLSNSKWMQFSFRVKLEFTSICRATLHTDHSTRPHFCFENDNPKFFSLLKAFEKKYGFPILGNTSFNFAGMPLVSNPQEAFLLLDQSDLDLLVINNTIYLKND